MSRDLVDQNCLAHGRRILVPYEFPLSFHPIAFREVRFLGTSTGDNAVHELEGRRSISCFIPLLWAPPSGIAMETPFDGDSLS
jgi:hypothetical protein